MSSEKQPEGLVRLAIFGAILIVGAVILWVAADVLAEPHNASLNLAPMAPEPIG
ncbi:MAG TPA: hypothetical protein PLN33_01045 [Hyphomonadaceae bacterium]|jgi:hypothetical protein|nr:hypothetical protein [Hyphomonadaceae bacterium]HPN04476.1 hypothetical protein [Hyphomonadaceae bacterium]